MSCRGVALHASPLNVAVKTLRHFLGIELSGLQGTRLEVPMQPLVGLELLTFGQEPEILTTNANLDV